MTREEAIALARECAAAKPEDYYSEPFQPHEWVVDAIMHAGNPHATVRDLVLDFRDCFLTLVSAYNAVGAYTNAQHAQAMAVTLHEFENKHMLTTLAWPLEIVRDDYGRGLKMDDGKVIYGEDL